MTDGEGRALDREGDNTTGTVGISYVLAYMEEDAEGNPLNWTAYTTRDQTSPITGITETQASSESDGTYTAVAPGRYRYTFTTPVDAANADLTHTIAAYATRTVDGVRAVSNHDIDFLLGGGDPTTSKETVTDASCNACHAQLSAPRRLAPGRQALPHVPLAPDRRPGHREHDGLQGHDPQDPHGRGPALGSGGHAVLLRRASMGNASPTTRRFTSRRRPTAARPATPATTPTSGRRTPSKRPACPATTEPTSRPRRATRSSPPGPTATSATDRAPSSRSRRRIRPADSIRRGRWWSSSWSRSPIPRPATRPPCASSSPWTVRPARHHRRAAQHASGDVRRPQLGLRVVLAGYDSGPWRLRQLGRGRRPERRLRLHGCGRRGDTGERHRQLHGRARGLHSAGRPAPLRRRSPRCSPSP
jgi:hypothetical protein